MRGIGGDNDPPLRIGQKNLAVALPLALDTEQVNPQKVGKGVALLGVVTRVEDKGKMFLGEGIVGQQAHVGLAVVEPAGELALLQLGKRRKLHLCPLLNGVKATVIGHTPDEDQWQGSHCP